MKYYIITTFVCFWLVLVIIMGVLFTRSVYHNQEMSVKILESYTFSTGFDNENPFESKTIDTVVVLGVTDEYCKWVLKKHYPNRQDLFFTGELKFFKHCARSITKKQ